MFADYPGIKDDILLRRTLTAPWSLNAYALICGRTQLSALVDPGAEPEALLDMLRGTTPAFIIVTHHHFDHTGALETMRRKLKAPVVAHVNGVQADHPVGNGDVLTLGHHRICFIHAPGHAPDQICLHIEKDNRYLVGDAIFDGGPGHTVSNQAFRQTLATLRQVVLAWPDEAICFPGHGPCFCLKDKRGAVEAFLAKDHGPFYGDAHWEM